MTSKRKKGLLISLAVVLAAVLVFGLYVGDYYRADREAIRTLSVGMAYERLDDGTLVCSPDAYESAVIFYPGGKVETEAYIPLMAHCAREGILSILMPMPFHLAVLDVDAAEDIPAQFPEVERWYMAGHSLGGSMAAAFAGEHSDWVEGLVLLAAYSTEEVHDLQVLSIYGSEDGVLNMEKYEQYRGNLPEDVTEVVLEGGNHAGFGAYGAQDGDGSPAISNQEQIQQTAKLIAEFVK